MADVYYVNLTWTDNSDNEEGFDVYRGFSAETMVLIDSVAADVTEYADHGDDNEGLNGEIRHYYQVRSRNKAGSGASNIYDIRIRDLAPIGTASISVQSQAAGDVVISWSAVPNSNGYHVAYQPVGGDVSTIVTLDDVIGTTTTLEGLDQNTQYTVWVTPFNEFGDTESTPGSLIFTTDVWVPTLTSLGLSVDDLSRLVVSAGYEADWEPDYDRVQLEISIGDQVSWFRPADAYQTNMFFSYISTVGAAGTGDGVTIYVRMYGQFTDGHPTDPVIEKESMASNILSIVVDSTVVAPSAPQTFATTSIPHGVRLTWTAPATGTPNSYTIYYYEGTLAPIDYTYMDVVGQVDSSTFEFDHNRGVEEEDGWYMVEAANQSGVGQTAIIIGQTGTGQVDFTLTAVYGHGVKIRWNNSSSLEDGYEIHVRESANPDVYLKIYDGAELDTDEFDDYIWYPTIQVVGPAYQHDGNHINRIRLQSMNGAAIESYVDKDYTWPLIGSPLPSIDLISQSQGDVTIEWSITGTGFESQPDTKFRLWREIVDTQERVHVATLPGDARSFVDTTRAVNGPAYDTTYHYWIEAFTESGTVTARYSLPSQIVTGGIITAPTDLYVYRMDTEVELRWTADTNANHYNVYRAAKGASGPFSLYEYIGQAGAFTGIYIDNTVLPDYEYRYYVTAEIPGYETPASNTAWADMDGKLPLQNYVLTMWTIPTGRQMYNGALITYDISWTLGGPNNRRIDVYATEVDDDPYDTGFLCQSIRAPDGASSGAIIFWDDRLLAGHTYYIGAVAVDDFNEPQPVGEGRAIHLVAFPDDTADDVDDLTGTYNSSAQTMTLNWTNTSATRTNIRIFGVESEYFDANGLIMNELLSVDANETSAVISGQSNNKHKRYMLMYWDSNTNTETGRSNVIVHGRLTG